MEAIVQQVGLHGLMGCLFIYLFRIKLQLIEDEWMDLFLCLVLRLRLGLTKMFYTFVHVFIQSKAHFVGSIEILDLL